MWGAGGVGFKNIFVYRRTSVEFHQPQRSIVVTIVAPAAAHNVRMIALLIVLAAQWHPAD